MEQSIWNHMVSMTISAKPCKHGKVNCWRLFDIHIYQLWVSVSKWVYTLVEMWTWNIIQALCKPLFAYIEHSGAGVCVGSPKPSCHELSFLSAFERQARQATDQTSEATTLAPWGADHVVDHTAFCVFLKWTEMGLSLKRVKTRKNH